MTLAQILRDRQVQTVFQPIVDLERATIVAYEALSRGPRGELGRPDRMYAAARAEDRLAELDALCRSTALRTAVAVGITLPLMVFVNVEPEVLDIESLDELVQIAESAPGGLQVVLEITERAISARPAELLSCVRRLRAAGWRIALDDVGADDMSLAFMPLLRPDVVKLDIKLVQERPGPAVAGIMNAVNAYAQRTGAVLLAEGIENETHLEIARALGAQLGQGWMFGRPAPGMSTTRPSSSLQLSPSRTSRPEDSPFECLPASMPLRYSTKPLLIELSKHLEQEALRHGSTSVVVSTFQYAHHFTPATAHRYERLAAEIGFVAAIGRGLPDEPVPGVRGADLQADDRLHDEWDIIVLAPHFSAALLARDLGDSGPDLERRFEFALTYDRDTVSAAAESLLSRVAPVSPQYPVAPSAPMPSAGLAPLVTARPAMTHATAGFTATVQRALAATSNGIAIADVTRPDHPLIYVNAAFEQLSGMQATQILGANCRILQGEATDSAEVARMRTAIAHGIEYRGTILNYRRGSGEPWWNEIVLTPVFDDRGTLVQYIGVQNDVSARIAAETELDNERARSIAYLAEIESLAFHDPLTGLFNRRRLTELLTDTLVEAETSRTGIGFLYIDINGFKHINDSCGHSTGDRLLRYLASQLSDLSRASFASRLGGDEFLVVLPGLERSSSHADSHRCADTIRDRLQSQQTKDLSFSVSVGVSTYPADGADFDALLHAADARMYSDKMSTKMAAPVPAHHPV